MANSHALDREEDLHLIVPVVDRPFELPAELARIKGMRNAMHYSFSEMVRAWNRIFETPKGNKFTGYLDPINDDLLFRLSPAKSIPGTKNMSVNRLRFNYRVAPTGFTRYAEEHFVDRNAVFDRLAPEQRMGGNNLNAFNTRAAWLQVFAAAAEEARADLPLPKQLAVISNGIEGQQNISREHIESLVDSHPDLFDMKILDGVSFRRSLHVPFTAASGNPDTLMLGEPHPEKEQIIQAMLQAFDGDLERQRFHQVFVPFNIRSITNNMRQQVLIPSSAFLDDILEVIQAGDVFAGNDQEFQSATGGHLPEVVFPNGDVRRPNMQACENVIQQHWAPTGEEVLEHVAPIGLRDGNTMATHRYGNHMYGVQVAPVRGDAEEIILQHMQRDDIGKNVPGANTTGGGDSKLGTQTIMTSVLPKYLPLWLERYSYNLSEQQQRYVVMGVAESLGAMVAHIVRNSKQASLWNVPTESLSRLLHTTIESVVRSVAEKGEATEMFFKAPYGVQVGIWQMKDVPVV